MTHAFIHRRICIHFPAGHKISIHFRRRIGIIELYQIQVYLTVYGHVVILFRRKFPFGRWSNCKFLSILYIQRHRLLLREREI
ncbi:Uncharacterised protein [Segatella copri]|nr:Uncharacterised protein [Segatella copri]